MYYNATTRQLQSNPPWSGWVSDAVKQSQYGDWQEVSNDFVMPRELTEEKARKRQEINRQRDELEAATPFIYLAKPFDYDKTSRERLGKAIQGVTLALLGGAAPETIAAEWTLADNTKLPMTLVDLAGLPSAEMARSQFLHNRAGEIKARIEAAASVEAVDAILAEAGLWEGE